MSKQQEVLKQGTRKTKQAGRGLSSPRQSQPVCVSMCMCVLGGGGEYEVSPRSDISISLCKKNLTLKSNALTIHVSNDLPTLRTSTCFCGPRCQEQSSLAGRKTHSQTTRLGGTPTSKCQGICMVPIRAEGKEVLNSTNSSGRRGSRELGTNSGPFT